MSELIQNLTYIYNEKLLLKDAIGTESDDFMQYHTYVNALKPSGTSYITSNGDYDISSYSYVNVDVEGGGSGSSADPFYDYTTPSAMIANEEESADYVSSTISENFTVTLDENDEVEAVEWDENITIDVEGTEVDKVVHVIVNGDPHNMLSTASNMESDFEDYSDLYDDNVYPILENATLTASEDPSGDGYDYLLEGDIYAWNLSDNCAQVEEITENGFVPSNGVMGFNVNVQAEANTGEAEFTTNGKYYAENDGLDGWYYVKVNVPSSGITPSGTSYINTNGSHDVTSYATAYVNVSTSLSGTYTKVLAGGLWDGWDLIDLQNIAPRYLSLATLHDITYDGGTPEYYCLRLEYTNGNAVSTENHPGYNQTTNSVEGDVCVINSLANGNYTFKVYLQHYVFDNVDDFTLDSDTVLNPSTPYIDISIAGNISDKNLELWNSGGSNLVWHVYYKGSEIVFHA